MNFTRTASGTIGLIAVFLALADGGPVLAQCEIDKVTAGGGADGDKFGFAVAISGDYAVVGAYKAGNGGAAYVFERDGLDWVEVTELEPFDVTIGSGDDYGRSVAIDGDVAVVGARRHDVSVWTNVSDAGTAYVFRRDAGGVWQSEGELIALIPQTDDEFGYAVAVSGNWIAVGAPNEDGPNSLIEDSGSVYAFEYDGAGSWIWQKKVRAADPGESDNFGRAVSLDADHILVGAERDDISGVVDAGSVYVFRRDPGQIWMQEAKLTARTDSGADDAQANDKFGYPVGIDGDRLVIGSRFHDGVGSNSGAAYVYEWDGEDWTIEKKLTSPAPAGSGQFGQSVAIRGDLILVGSRDDVAGVDRAGAAYLFRKGAGTWEWAQTFENSDPHEKDFFGDSCAIDGDYAIAGALNDNISGGADGPGAAHLLWVTTVEYCNPDGIADLCQIIDGSLADDNDNGIPDQCECQPTDSCDDGLDCTTDVCDPSTLLCAHEVDPGFCAILGECGTNGEERPGHECQECNPMLDPRAWSAKADGTACADDGAFCTGEEVCLDGLCRSTGNPCAVLGFLCDESTDTCVECLADADCHDGNNCTDDGCDAGTCVFPNSAPGKPCGDPTEVECDHANTCDGFGSCIANFEPAGAPCGDTSETECDLPDTCDGAGLCTPNLRPSGTLCGDPTANACTGPDTCNNAGQCQANHLPDDTPCPDEYWCNGEESCAQGMCVPGAPPCDRPWLSCDEVSDSCDCLGGSEYVLYVDDDAAPDGDGLSWATAYDSLSTALATAQPCEQVWVATGTYGGLFTLALEVEVYGGFAGTETELSQRDWTANPTILGGHGYGSVVTAPTGATATTRIDGFTITNGRLGTHLGDGLFGGGGLFLNGSSPTIANNTITGNTPHDLGGGVYMSDSSPTITNNTIANNSVHYSGGGVYLRSSSPTIANNTITGNSVGDHGRGGGVHVGYDSSGTITNNTITGNDAGFGGGVYLSNSSPTVTNNTISGNNVQRYGGGVYLYESSPTIANNTITGNSSYEGGGLYLVWLSSPTMANTIVAFNSSGIYRQSGTLSLGHNCVYGNTAYDYFRLTDPTGTDGNISADPLFIRNPDDGGDGWGDHPGTPDVDEGANDDYGDLRLLSGSPGIDAGDNDAVPADGADLDDDGDIDEPIPLDLDGFPRFVDDPLTTDTGNPGALGPPVVDMGAYESFVDCNHNAVPDGVDIATGTSRDRFPPAWGGDGVPDECQKYRPRPTDPKRVPKR